MRLKKSVKRVLVLVLIALILILAGIIYYFGFYKKDGNEIKVVKEISEYGYKLRENSTDLYKKNFNKLNKILSDENVDEEEYVKTIAQMFIIDFYTLDNKIAKSNVGGVDFIEDSIRSNFYTNALDTYYKYVESNMYGDRKQELPRVISVKIEDVKKGEFTYGDKKDEEAYFVKMSWKYKKESDYQDSAELVFVHDNKKMVLVELN